MWFTKFSLVLVLFYLVIINRLTVDAKPTGSSEDGEDQDDYLDDVTQKPDDSTLQEVLKVFQQVDPSFTEADLKRLFLTEMRRQLFEQFSIKVREFIEKALERFKTKMEI